MKYNKNNPLKVVTLCSGYDSQCMALDRLKEIYPDFDYDLVAWSEIDKIMNVTSKAQGYKLAGNSIVVSCMQGIFENLFINPEEEIEINKNQQLTIF